MAISYSKEWDQRILSLIRLKRLIKKKGKLGAFAISVGMPFPEVSRVLSGYMRLDPEQLVMWAERLGLSQRDMRSYLEGE